MKNPIIRFALAGVALAAAACQGAPTAIDPGHALQAQSVEFAVDTGGSVVEIEYHVDHAEVPVNVRTAFNNMRPGVTPTAAEHEFHGGDEFWELAALIGGMKVEVMFRPDGSVVSEEIEVTTNSVPADVRRAADDRFDGADHGQWEMIRDGRGDITEYHVKFEQGGKHHKVALSPSGGVLGVWYEVPAEIEVPVGR